MDKYGKIIGILLGISLIFGLSSAIFIQKQQQAVSATVTNQQGDSSLVENLVFTAQTGGGYVQEVWWNTEIPLAHPENTNTLCQRETTEQWQRSERFLDTKFAVEWRCPDLFFFHDPVELDFLENQALQQVITGVYNRMGDQEIYAETVSAESCNIRPTIFAHYERKLGENKMIYDWTEITNALDLAQVHLPVTITLHRHLHLAGGISCTIQIADAGPQLFSVGQDQYGYFLACPNQNKGGTLYRYTYGTQTNYDNKIISRETLATLPQDWETTGFLLEESRLIIMGPAAMLIYDLETDNITQMPLPQKSWSAMALDDAILIQTEAGDYATYVWQQGTYTKTIEGTWSVEDVAQVSCGYVDGVLIRQIDQDRLSFSLHCYGENGQFYGGDYTLSQNQEKGVGYSNIGWRLYRDWDVPGLLQCHSATEGSCP